MNVERYKALQNIIDRVSTAISQGEDGLLSTMAKLPSPWNVLSLGIFNLIKPFILPAVRTYYNILIAKCPQLRLFSPFFTSIANGLKSLEAS